MGILNVTPDSFYAGSRMQSIDVLLQKAEQMLEDGASILDVGGLSTRPGAAMIQADEECSRVVPAIEALIKHFPSCIISIDTYRAKVAQEAINAGASIVNDVSAWNIDSELLEVVATNQVPYILMHMQGVPQNMQKNPHYEDLMLEVMDFFIKKIAILKQKKVVDIILDVGFGFGKNLNHNYQLLNNLHVFQTLELPLLAGVSRKSMIWKLLEVSPEQAINGTTALNMVALQQGAKILRVHDVRQASEVTQLWQQLELNLES